MADFQVRQIDHVELFVPDQREAAAWYARVFGLRVLDEFEHWETDLELVRRFAAAVADR